MILLDSNIIIYSTRPEYAALRQLLDTQAFVVSGISIVETLGYHLLQSEERVLLEAFFSAALVMPVDELVLSRAVALRQMRRMSLGDSIVAGTAQVHGLELLTRNTRDFTWIEGLLVRDPI